MVVQVQIGSTGQLFHAGLINSLSKVLGKPCIVNRGEK